MAPTASRSSSICCWSAVPEPSVTAAIVVHDGERYLAEALESILAQTRPPDEILVVDDGSTDATPEVVAGFGEAVRLVRQENAGPGAARNRAAADARGDMIAFLDHDDRWTPDKLALQLDAIARDPSVETVFGHMVEFASPELPADVVAGLTVREGTLPAPIAGTLLTFRDTIMRAGGFGTDNHAAETLEWLVRADEQGVRRIMLPETVLHRRIHEANFHRRNPGAAVDYVRTLKGSLDRRRARETS
jgi:glycosyltransferase involved in cell wall biosynthesis